MNGWPLKRVRYFAGQLLTADDFGTEQNYLREKSRRHNRYLHGYGVVSGLEVGIRDNLLVIHPGMALNCVGDEIAVPEPAEFPLPRRKGELYLAILYEEKETDPIPVPGPEEGSQNSRIEERYGFTYLTDHPASDHNRKGTRWLPCGRPHGIPLARIIYAEGRWRVDRRFRRPQLDP